MIKDEEFALGERVQVVEPVVWPETDGATHITRVFAPGEDLYVVGTPEGTNTDRYVVRCPGTGVQGEVSGVMLVSMPPYGETLQRALQTARLSQTSLMGVVGTLLQKQEHQQADEATKEAVAEHGPAFVNVIFSGAPGPDGECVFIEVEDDEGKSLNAGEWRDRGDGTWALRMPYGGSPKQN